MQQSTNDQRQGKDVADDCHYPGGEHFVEGVDIGGHPRDQSADRIPVKESQVEPLQLSEHLLPDIVEHFLSHPDSQVGLGISHHSTANQYHEKENNDGVETFNIFRRQIVVNGHLDQVRNRHLGQGYHQ